MVTKERATKKRARPRLSDKQLADVLALIKDSDSVELKLTVVEEEQRSAVRSLGMDPLDAQIRQVFFFDTPDLDLNKAGLVVRARRVQRKGDDSVVKLRPVVPSALSADMRTSPNLSVEVDAMPGGYVCSATMKRSMDIGSVKSIIDEGRSIKGLFSKEQRRFFAQHAPEGIDFDGLSTFGPIFVLKLKFRPQGYEGKLVAELWMYPDNSRVLELSTKCEPNDAFRVAAETRVFLSKHGISLDDAQETKTRKALQFFSDELKAS